VIVSEVIVERFVDLHLSRSEASRAVRTLVRLAALAHSDLLYRRNPSNSILPLASYPVASRRSAWRSSLTAPPCTPAARAA
jgi:hypothetical protein